MMINEEWARFWREVDRKDENEYGAVYGANFKET
jgi:hypothetical protein